MNVLEFLNAYPGETFLYEHGKALSTYTDIKLSWAYTQTTHSGIITPSMQCLQHCFSLPNFNRMPFLRKASLRIKYALLPLERAKKRAVLHMVEKVQPNWIHFHFAGTAIQWSWVAEELQVPFTFSVRGSDVQVAPFTIDGYLSKLKDTGSRAAKIHAVCDALKIQYCHLTDTTMDKVQVIRTAINKDWGTIERKPQKGSLISVGRLHWRKGYPDLLLAAHQLKKEGMPFQLYIIGEGPDRPYLEYMLRDLSLESNVQLVGSKSHTEIRSYMETTDLYVQSSIAEGFPNAVAEAMLANIPVVATDCGGVSEIIQHGVNGYLSKVGTPQDLAQQIKTALAVDNNFIAEAGKNDALKHFSANLHGSLFKLFWKNGL